MVDLDGWHCHFRHAGIDSICILSQKELVDSLKDNAEIKGVYEDCIYGEHKSRPYNGKTMIEKNPNNYAHIDLWGLESVALLRGVVYMMLVTDGGLSHLAEYFLTQKTLQQCSQNSCHIMHSLNTKQGRNSLEYVLMLDKNRSTKSSRNTSPHTVSSLLSPPHMPMPKIDL